MKYHPFEKNVRQSGMVRVRGGFSDTYGINPISRAIQIDEFDDSTRTRISNRIINCIKNICSNTSKYFFPRNNVSSSFIEKNFVKSILDEVFCESNATVGLDTLDSTNMIMRIEDVISNATYNEVLDIVQYCANWIESRIELNKGCFYNTMNDIFEQECVGYRFIEGKIVPITDKQEIAAIEEACKEPYKGCRAHIQKAVGFLSDRTNKDYKNCIKESISAVESICEQIIGDEKATLGEALKKLEDNGVSLHPSLKQGFSKLYGYTSDEGGIRHAEGLFESNVTFEEAKYMLVSCSAFVNYLIAVSGKGSN